MKAFLLFVLVGLSAVSQPARAGEPGAHSAPLALDLRLAGGTEFVLLSPLEGTKGFQINPATKAKYESFIVDATNNKIMVRLDDGANAEGKPKYKWQPLYFGQDGQICVYSFEAKTPEKKSCRLLDPSSGVEKQTVADLKAWLSASDSKDKEPYKAVLTKLDGKDEMESLMTVVSLNVPKLSELKNEKEFVQEECFESYCTYRASTGRFAGRLFKLFHGSNRVEAAGFAAHR